MTTPACPRCVSPNVIRESDGDSVYDMCLACGHYANEVPVKRAGYDRDTERLKASLPEPPPSFMWRQIQAKAARGFRERSLSIREIALEMGVSVRSVNRYFRARCS